MLYFLLEESISICLINNMATKVLGHKSVGMYLTSALSYFPLYIKPLESRDCSAPSEPSAVPHVKQVCNKELPVFWREKMIYNNYTHLPSLTLTNLLSRKTKPFHKTATWETTGSTPY